MKIELPVFGITNLNEEEGYEYQFYVKKWKYDFEDKKIDLDVNFKEVNESKIDKVKSSLNKLLEIHKIGIEAIQKDFKEGEVVKEYIEEWNEDIFLQMFDEDEFQKFIEDTDKEERIEKRLLSLIRIVRIGIYVESENSFITMDFAFGYDSKIGFRDDMLVVTINPEFKVTDICTEG